MAQNVTIMGASYPDVPAVELPKTGGGTALFADPSVTTAQPEDVAAGKIFLNAQGEPTEGTGSGGGGGVYQDQDGYIVLDPEGGGGGASNVVSGTFTGTTSGVAMDVTIPYTGNGYPVAGIIYPSVGAYKTGDIIPSLVQYGAIIVFSFAKCDISSVPTYYGEEIDENFASSTTIFKGSASDDTNPNRTLQNIIYSNYNASGYLDSVVRIKSPTLMSVYINSSGTGFITNVAYTYHIIYSS